MSDVASGGGLKYDSGKLPLELIPPEAMEALGTVLAYGAQKYAARNWERGISFGRLFGATMRHLWAFWRRQDDDPESGHPHLWHAFTTLAMLVALVCRRPDLDDRPGGQNEAE